MNINLENRTLFDNAAQAYNRFRPSYPVEAVKAVVDFTRLTSASRILEVGAGTGKASILFAPYGFAIDCLEPGKNLSALARANCSSWPNVSVIPQTFEAFPSSPERYDLIYAAQSFHWIHPEIRFKKAHNLLSRHGSIAVMYNYTQPPEKGLSSDIRDTIDKASNGQMKYGNYEEEVAHWSSEIKANNLFFNLQIERFRWRSEYSAEQFSGLLSTFSSFLALNRERQLRVIEAVAAAFAAHKQNLVRDCICVVFLARKNRRKTV